MPDEVDCLVAFERKLEERKILSRTAMDDLRARYTQQLLEASKIVREEPQPEGSSIWKHVFAEAPAPSSSGNGGEPRNAAH